MTFARDLGMVGLAGLLTHVSLIQGCLVGQSCLCLLAKLGWVHNLSRNFTGLALVLGFEGVGRLSSLIPQQGVFQGQQAALACSFQPF